MKTLFIILAAGEGTRMKTDTLKVLHTVANKKMLFYVIDAVKNLGDIALIVNEELSAILEYSLNHYIKNDNLSIHVQSQQLGTGHAVSLVSNLFESYDNVVVLYGDTPCITSETVQKILEDRRVLDEDFGAKILLFPSSEGEYGRAIFDENGNLAKIIEYRDASVEERESVYCNSGIMVISARHGEKLLNDISCDNKKGEYYLTDIAQITLFHNLKLYHDILDKEEILGANTLDELSDIEEIIQNRLKNNAMLEGVKMLLPHTTYLSAEIEFGKNVVIEQSVYIGNNVRIGNNVTIKAFSYIEDDNVIGDAVNIGPFARIRSNNSFDSNCKVGNFVEVKNSKLGQNTKVSHLSYIGDIDIGKNCNIGAGAVICNYDGFQKYRSFIGDNVFLGSNTTVISPIQIYQNAIIAAGTVVTQNIPQNSLAVSRIKQKNYSNGADKVRKNRQN